MKKIISVVAVALALSGATLFAGDAKTLYENQCTKCHGADGKGDTKMGKRTGAKDYSDPKVQDALKDEVAFKSIKEGLKDKEGKTLMNPTTDVSDDDIKALVTYMRTFKK